MSTQSIGSSSFIPQSYLNDADVKERGHERNKGVEENRRHSLQRLNELAGDVSNRNRSQEAERTASVTTEMALQTYAERISHSADIQITTQEGDVVTINLQELSAKSQSEFQAQQGGNSLSIYSESSSQSSSFSFSVEGDLNEDEQKSLTDLINKMTKVSDKFFAGDTASAFKHAQKIGFDSDQISGFSMDLNRQKSVEAVAAYQQTTVPDQNVNTDLLQQASDFLAQTKDFLADANAMLDFLEQPQQGFNDLFAGMAQIQPVDPNPIEDKKGQDAFLDMINNVSSDVFGEAEDE